MEDATKQETKPEDLKKKGTEVEEETGWLSHLYLHLPSRSAMCGTFLRAWNF